MTPSVCYFCQNNIHFNHKSQTMQNKITRLCKTIIIEFLAKMSFDLLGSWRLSANDQLR